jgi:hypothetical protein
MSTVCFLQKRISAEQRFAVIRNSTLLEIFPGDIVVGDVIQG